MKAVESSNIYQIYNARTNMLVGNPFKCAKRARNKAEKLDLEYGAYAYKVKNLSTGKIV
jgi:hypothetical protein